MHYCENPAMVRVDFFKDSGKWYTTEAVKWLFYGNESFLKMDPNHPYAMRRMQSNDAVYLSIHDIFAISLYNQLGSRLNEMTAICLVPYHIDEHPLSMRNWVEKAEFILNDHPFLRNYVKATNVNTP
jgi:hypothetical protein